MIQNTSSFVQLRSSIVYKKLPMTARRGGSRRSSGANPHSWPAVLPIFVLSALAVGLVPSGDAAACSLVPMPFLEDVLPGQPIEDWPMQPVVGIYEFEFIAHSPGWLGSARSVTVVTRTWGTPPQDTGPLGVVEGCGADPAGVGQRGYGWVEAQGPRERPEFRNSWSLGGTDGDLTAHQEAMLVDRFGPTVAIDVPPQARLTAFMSVWRRELLLLTGLVGVAVLVLIGRPRHRSRSVAAHRAAESNPAAAQ